MKKIAIGLAGIFTLVLVLLAIAPIFFSVDDLKPKLETLAESHMNADVSLGELKLSFLPSLTLSAKKVIIVAKAPFNKKESIAADALTLKVSWLNFFFSPHASIQLKAPLISFFKIKNKSNFDQLFSNSKTEAALTTKQTEIKEEATSSLPLGLGLWLTRAKLDIGISDGKFLYSANPSKYNFSDIDFRLENFGMDREIPAELSFDIDAKDGATKLKGPVSLEGSMSMQSSTGRKNYALTGDLSSLSMKLSELLHKKKGTKLTIDVDFLVNNSKYDFQKFNFAYGKSNIDSQLLLNFRDGANELSAIVSSELLDLDELLALPNVKTSSNILTKNRKIANKSQPLMVLMNEFSTLFTSEFSSRFYDELKATAQLSFKKIIALKSEFKKVKTKIQVANRKAKITNFSLRVYEGNLSGNFEMALVPKAQQFSLNTSIQGLQLQPALKAFLPDWEKMIDGNVFASLHLNGKGVSYNEVERNLTGSSNGSVKNGIVNVPLKEKLSEIADTAGSIAKALSKSKGEKISSQLAKLKSVDDHKGSFKKLLFKAKVKGTKATLDPFDLIYSSDDVAWGELRFLARGFVTLEQQMDLAGTAFLDPDKVNLKDLIGKSGKVELPVRVTGSFEKPKPDIDYTRKILTKRMGKVVLNKNKEKIKEKAKGLLDKFKKKFKF